MDDLLPSNAAWRAMIVDDHRGQRELARALFQALGFEVRLCASGEEAVETGCGAAFEVILMDRNMPGFGGDEAARRLRGPDSQSRRALIVSHSTDPPGSLSTTAYDRVVTKPISTCQIIALMEECARRFGQTSRRPG